MSSNAIFVDGHGLRGEAASEVVSIRFSEEGGVSGVGLRGWRRNVVIGGAALSGVLLVCTLAFFSLESGGMGTTELAGRYDYGRYGGLAPEDTLQRQVRENPHDLVYYNVFTDKAVSPHRWLSSDNFRVVMQKALAMIRGLDVEASSSGQEKVNGRLLAASETLDKRLDEIKVQAKEARDKVEANLMSTIKGGAEAAETEGMRQLDAQKEKYAKILTSKADALNNLLAQAEAASNTKLRGLADAIAAEKSMASDQFGQADKSMADLEGRLANADSTATAQAAGIDTRVEAGKASLRANTLALKQDLLTAKLALSSEVDNDVVAFKEEIRDLIVQLRILIVRQMKESFDRSRARLGDAGAAIERAYNKLKGDVAQTVSEEEAFQEKQRMTIDDYNTRSKALVSSVVSGRLHDLDTTAKTLVADMGATIRKLEAEQKAGALFLEASADGVLGGMFEQLQSEQASDEEAMVHSRESLQRAQAALQMATDGRLWKDRDAYAAQLRGSLTDLENSLTQIEGFRRQSIANRASAVASSQSGITHGFVAQFWWILADAKKPSIYSPPDRQVITEVMGTAVAKAGVGREECAGGMPTAAGVGVFARQFGVFDADLAGEYTLWLRSSGVATIWVDMVQYVKVSGSEDNFKVTLQAGPHTVWVEHASAEGAGQLNVDVEGPQLKRQVLNGWHSAKQPGWLAQLYFWPDQLTEMPAVKGIQPSREGIALNLDYEGWIDWSRALTQGQFVPTDSTRRWVAAVGGGAQQLPSRLSSFPGVVSECLEAKRSPLQTVEGAGAECEEGVMERILLGGFGCEGRTAARANFTCLDAPKGSCSENLGDCQDFDSSLSTFAATCRPGQAISALRVQDLGCSNGERRLAWKCCELTSVVNDNSTTTVADGRCQSLEDSDGGIGASCGDQQALVSWSVTRGRCPTGSLALTAACGNVPADGMPIGRVVARFWGIMGRPGSSRLYAESAGGSKLIVDGNMVVDNDGIHAQRTKFKDVQLGSKGHIIQALWFQDKGPEVLKVTQGDHGVDRGQAPLKTWHYAPPQVPANIKNGGHLSGGVLQFLGYGYSFVQQAEFVRMPSLEFSLAVWVKPEGDQGATGAIITYGVVGGDAVASLGKASSLTAEVLGFALDTGINVADGRWRHVALTWSSDEGRLVVYVDGDPVVTRIKRNQGKSVPNGGCVVLGQKWAGKCGEYADEGAYQGQMIDAVIGSSAWAGDAVRAAMLETGWASPSNVRWAVTRRQDAPLAYVSGQANILCALDASPFGAWRSGEVKPCTTASNVQWRDMSELIFEQATRNRGTPRAMIISGYGRAVALRTRFTEMPQTDITIAMWVKVTSEDEPGVLLSYGDSSAGKGVMPFLQVDTPRQLEVSIMGSVFTTLVDVADGNWHHIAITWSAASGVASFSIEGKQVIRQLSVAKAQVIPNGGCMAIGAEYWTACGGSSVPQAADQSSGLIAEMADVMIYNSVLAEGYIRATMHSEMPSFLARGMLKLSLTGDIQYSEDEWLPKRPREVSSALPLPSCARHGGLRSSMYAAGGFKTTSECRYRCATLAGDYTVLRTTDAAKTLEVQARMVTVQGGKLSFPDAIGVDYLGDKVTVAGSATDAPYYILNGRAITSFPAVGSKGMQVLCARGTAVGCAMNTTETGDSLFQIYTPDGSLVSFWTLEGQWGGYEVQLPLECWATRVEGLAGSMSHGVVDFAVGGDGSKFDELDHKCAAKGPLATEMEGMFDAEQPAGATLKRWCETWKVAGPKKVIYDKNGKLGPPAQAITVPQYTPPPVNQSDPVAVAVAAARASQRGQCEAFKSRPSWYEACKAAEANWGQLIGADSLLAAKGMTQELRSERPNPHTIYDSSPAGQNFEGRGVILGGDGKSLTFAKRLDPEDLSRYITFPEQLSLWEFTAQPWDMNNIVGRDGVQGLNIVCVSLDSLTCEQNDKCKVSGNAACIPKECADDDAACVRRGGIRVGIAPPIKTSGVPGWCSKWYINPYEQPIDSMPDFRRISPQKAVVVGSLMMKNVEDMKNILQYPYAAPTVLATTARGVLVVAVAGMYTFCTNSDDGTEIIVDGQTVVSASCCNKMCGSVELGVGDHDENVRYYNKMGPGALQITYKGPDTDNKEIPLPSKGFWGDCLAENPTCSKGMGWCGRFYWDADGPNSLNINNMPKFNTMVAQAARSMNEVHFNRYEIPAYKLGGFARTAVVFEGVLHINTPGEYTMWLWGDDQSRMFVDGILVVVDPNVNQLISGKIKLATGDHDIRVEYFDNGGEWSLDISYQGPDTGNNRLTMPSMRRPYSSEIQKFEAVQPQIGASNVKGTANALEKSGGAYFCARFYENEYAGANIGAYMDQRRMFPNLVTPMAKVDLPVKESFVSVIKNSNPDHLVAEIDGVLTIDMAGSYTFCITSDDGSWLWIDGKLIADNGGNHGPIQVCGKQDLSVGDHTSTLRFYQGEGGSTLQLYYRGPDTTGLLIPMPSSGYQGDCKMPIVDCKCGTVGWCARFYYSPKNNDQMTSMPDFGAIRPQSANSVQYLEFHDGNYFQALENRVSVRSYLMAGVFEGVLDVDKGGEYNMCIISEAKGELYLDNVLTASASSNNQVCAKVMLAVGDHSMRVLWYTNYNGAPRLRVLYQGPDTNNLLIAVPSSRHPCDPNVDHEGYHFHHQFDLRMVEDTKTLDAGRVFDRPDDELDMGTDVAHTQAPGASGGAALSPPPKWQGVIPEGWSFLANDHVRLNGMPLTWAAALRPEPFSTGVAHIELRTHLTYQSGSFVGFAFLARSVSHLEAVVLRRAVRGQYAFCYHLVRLGGEERWSDPVQVFMAADDDWFTLSVDLVKRRVLINGDSIHLDLGFPKTHGNKIGLIGKGREQEWAYLRTEEPYSGVVPVKDIAVGVEVSLASISDAGKHIRVKGETTGLLSVTLNKGDVATVEPKPKLAVSMTVNGLTLRTDEVTGTTKPKWATTWVVPMPCRTMGDKMTFTLWDGQTSLGEQAIEVRTVEGATDSPLTIRITGVGVGGTITGSARFVCVSMAVELSNVTAGNSQEAEEATFRMVSGLADSAMVSFESVAFPSMFLARDGDRLRLARLAGRSSMEAGLVLYLYTVDKDEPEDLAEVLAKGPSAFDAKKPAVRVLIDSTSFPDGINALIPNGWEVAADAVTVGIVRGIIEAPDTGTFTFLAAGAGTTSTFIDGVKVQVSGEVNLDAGLHDIGMVLAGAGATELTWMGPLTKKQPVLGSHVASLASAGSFRGFETLATFDVAQGVEKGSVRLGSLNDGARAVRAKGSDGVWVCSPEGHMQALQPGLSIKVYALDDKTSPSDDTMPQWGYINPNMQALSPSLTLPDSARIQEVVGVCPRPPFVPKPPPAVPPLIAPQPAPAAPPAPLLKSGGVEPGQQAADAPVPAVVDDGGGICYGLKKDQCKGNKASEDAKKFCIYHTSDGCIPISCDPGDYDCQKAGGKNNLKRLRAQGKEAPMTFLAAYRGVDSTSLDAVGVAVGFKSRIDLSPAGCKENVKYPSQYMGLVVEGLVTWQEGGYHSFRLEGEGYAQLWVDGVLACEKHKDSQISNGRAKLSPGEHRVKLMWTQGANAKQGITALRKAPRGETWGDISGSVWRQMTDDDAAKQVGYQGSYEYRFDYSNSAASFAFRRGLYVHPPPPAGQVGPMSKQESIIPKTADALATPECAAYLLAPDADDKGRAALLGKCRSGDEAIRADKNCDFVDAHGFCYAGRYQSTCRAHRAQLACHESVPSPEYRACKCELLECTCAVAPAAGRATIMDAMPLKNDVDILAEESVAAWKYSQAKEAMISRCKAQVEVAYVELLRRPVDPLGLLTFTKQCIAKYPDGKSVEALQGAIKEGLPELSPFGVREYTKWVPSRTVAIAAIRDVMFREPDDSVELHKYTVNVAQGASQDNVESMLIFSDEYVDLRNNVALKTKRAEEMVTNVYREVLLRDATRDEVVTTSARFVDKQIKISKFAEDLAKTEECRRWCDIRKAVRGMFRNGLLREPDEGSWKLNARRMRQGWDAKRVNAEVLRSQEYLHMHVNLDANIAELVSNIDADLKSLKERRPTQKPIPEPSAVDASAYSDHKVKPSDMKPAPGPVPLEKGVVSVAGKEPAMCLGLNLGACTANAKCKHSKHCGCLPKTCECGNTECIEAGGPEFVSNGPGYEAAGGGWTLVRRVPKSYGKWHPATDRCAGTDVYGMEFMSPKSDADVGAWSTNFEDAVPGYDQIMFATGDGSMWLVTTKEAVGSVYKDWYSNQQRQIITASDNPDPHTAAWYNRADNPEDPWISLVNHEEAIRDRKIIYGEAASSVHMFLGKFNGANVFLRNTRKGKQHNSPGYSIMGGGWTLVRHVPKSYSRWHPATDHCGGTEEYGLKFKSPQSNADMQPWSVKFEKAVPGYDQILFAMGDGTKWLVTTKEAIGTLRGDWYSNQRRNIIASSDNPNPYQASWYNRPNNPEDPWVSINDYHTAEHQNKIVYGENSIYWHRGPLIAHNGANVFVRRTRMDREIVSNPAFEVLGGGWALVRRVPKSWGKWHPAIDHVAGTQVYGEKLVSEDPISDDGPWSTNFEDAVPGWDQIMFATGTGSMWLVTNKQAIGTVNKNWYNNQQRNIIAASDNPNPHTAAWYNRPNNAEDPWISLVNHEEATRDHKLLYGENNVNYYPQVLSLYEGANVYVRNTMDLQQPEVAAGASGSGGAGEGDLDFSEDEDEAERRVCFGLNMGECKAKPDTCEHSTSCGCIPQGCRCEDAVCIKAGGPEFVEDDKAEDQEVKGDEQEAQEGLAAARAQEDAVKNAQDQAKLADEQGKQAEGARVKAKAEVEAARKEVEAAGEDEDKKFEAEERLDLAEDKVSSSEKALGKAEEAKRDKLQEVKDLVARADIMRAASDRAKARAEVTKLQLSLRREDQGGRICNNLQKNRCMGVFASKDVKTACKYNLKAGCIPRSCDPGDRDCSKAGGKANLGIIIRLAKAKKELERSEGSYKQARERAEAEAEAKAQRRKAAQIADAERAARAAERAANDKVRAEARAVKRKARAEALAKAKAEAERKIKEAEEAVKKAAADAAAREAAVRAEKAAREERERVEAEQAEAKRAAERAVREAERAERERVERVEKEKELKAKAEVEAQRVAEAAAKEELRRKQDERSRERSVIMLDKNGNEIGRYPLESAEENVRQSTLHRRFEEMHLAELEEHMHGEWVDRDQSWADAAGAEADAAEKAQKEAQDRANELRERAVQRKQDGDVEGAERADRRGARFDDEAQRGGQRVTSEHNRQQELLQAVAVEGELVEENKLKAQILLLKNNNAGVVDDGGGICNGLKKDQCKGNKASEDAKKFCMYHTNDGCIPTSCNPGEYDCQKAGGKNNLKRQVEVEKLERQLDQMKEKRRQDQEKAALAKAEEDNRLARQAAAAAALAAKELAAAEARAEAEKQKVAQAEAAAKAAADKAAKDKADEDARAAKAAQKAAEEEASRKKVEEERKRKEVEARELAEAAERAKAAEAERKKKEKEEKEATCRRQNLVVCPFFNDCRWHSTGFLKGDCKLK